MYVVMNKVADPFAGVGLTHLPSAQLLVYGHVKLSETESERATAGNIGGPY